MTKKLIFLLILAINANAAELLQETYTFGDLHDEIQVKKMDCVFEELKKEPNVTRNDITQIIPSNLPGSNTCTLTMLLRHKMTSLLDNQKMSPGILKMVRSFIAHHIDNLQKTVMEPNNGYTDKLLATHPKLALNYNSEITLEEVKYLFTICKVWLIHKIRKLSCNDLPYPQSPQSTSLSLTKQMLPLPLTPFPLLYFLTYKELQNLLEQKINDPACWKLVGIVAKQCDITQLKDDNGNNLLHLAIESKNSALVYYLRLTTNLEHIVNDEAHSLDSFAPETTEFLSGNGSK